MIKRTECQRIIDEGILPESFFREEIICDFKVTTERKKIWAILLDLLLQVDKICRKHNLKYSATGGTLLGIIRHNGFIPWDDDLDIRMTRSDYNKFLKVAIEELPPQYFLQQPGKDNDYFFSFTKLRNSNTTRINKTFRYCKFNFGIGIDIFVLDNCRIDKIYEDFEKAKDLILENSAYMRRSNPNPSDDDIKRINQYNERNPHEVLEELSAIYEEANRIESEYCLPFGNCIRPAKNMLFKWDDLKEHIDIDFYGHKILIYKNYDMVLKSFFGNYMDLPPLEQRGTWHKPAIIDTDRPYTVVLKELLAT